MKLGSVLAAVAVVAMVSLLPAASAGPVVSRLPANTSCLTPEQEKQLQQAVKSIQETFGISLGVLRVAEAAERDPTIKKDIETAITVISAIDTYIIGNLTKIAESACPTCDAIVKTVGEAIESIEQTLAKIDPNWQNNPIWKTVVTLVTTILNIVQNFCPSTTTAAARIALHGV